LGEIVQASWYELPDHYASLELAAFVVMPNHVHGVVFLHGPVGAGLRPAPTPHERRTQVCGEGRRVSLSEILRAFRSFSARQINIERHTPGAPVWQRGFYEHVIRNEADLHRIRRYIEENPLRWAEDEENR
jgi:REP element-mobilizing transposase RayT